MYCFSNTRKRRRVQFTIPGILILMAALACFFAIYGAELRKVQSEIAVLRKIAKVTNDARLEYSRAEGIYGATHVSVLYFSNATITEGNVRALVQELHRLPHLICVDLGQSNVSVLALEDLKASCSSVMFGTNAGGLHRERLGIREGD